MTQASAELGVSDVGLKKISRRHRIPTPPRGYWQKLAVGQKPIRPPLPPVANAQRDEIEIRPTPPKAPPPPPEPVPAAVQAAIAHEQKPENRIVVAKTLRNPHRIVLAWIEEDRRDRQLHRSDWYLRTTKAIDGDALSRRRLLIVSALFIAIENRGYKLVVEGPYRRDVHVEHGPDRLQIEVAERMQQVRRTLGDEEHRERRHLSTGRKRWTQEQHATGELVAGIREGHSRSFVVQWRESADRPLEAQLNDVMVGVARRFDELRERREQQERARQRQWEEDRRRYQQEQERKREAVRFGRLVRQTQDRQLAADIRALVDAVRAKQWGAGSADAAAFERWSVWALAHADRIDPLRDGDIFDRSVGDQELYALGDNALTDLDRRPRTSFWGGWRGR